MFAVYHNHNGELVAINVGKQALETIVKTIASNGCGLDGERGHYYGVEAQSPEEAISSYENLKITQDAFEFLTNRGKSNGS